MQQKFLRLGLLTGMLLLSQMVWGQEWFKKGREATEPVEKVEYFTRSIQEERQDKWVYYFRAWAYHDMQRYERAIRDFQTAQNVEGTVPDSYLQSGLAWCYYRLEDYSKALALANAATESDPKNSDGWNIQGWVLLQLDQKDEAVAAFTKFKELNPDKASPYFNRSYAYAQTENFQACIEDCDRAMELGGENETLIERKAYAMIKLGQKEAAFDLVKEKINYQPQNPASTSAVADLFYRNEDYDDAISYYTLALRQFEKKVQDDREYRKNNRGTLYDIYLSRGEAYYAQENFQRALSDYKVATTVIEDDWRAWYQIGMLQTYRENWSEGAKGYEMAYSLNADLKNGYVNLGFCYDQMKEPGRAISAYSRGIQKNPNVGLLYNNRGFNYLELKQYEKALADLKKAIEVEPEVVMSHVSLGEYYYHRQNYSAAIEKFNQALAMEDGSDQAYSVAFYTRGMCYFSQEQFSKAKDNFIQALAVDPEHVLAQQQLGIAHYKLEEHCESYKALKKALDLEKNIPHTKKEAKDAPRYLGKMTQNPCH